MEKLEEGNFHILKKFKMGDLSTHRKLKLGNFHMLGKSLKWEILTHGENWN
jgi:hypothetical protein